MTKTNRRTLCVQTQTDDARRLLKGLEAQRAELGALAEDLIAVLRSAGIRPPAPDHATKKH